MNNVIPKFSPMHFKDFYSLCKTLFCNSSIDVVYYGKLYRNGDYSNICSNLGVWKYTWEMKKDTLFDYKLIDVLFDSKKFMKGKVNRICFFTNDIDQYEYWNKFFKEVGVAAIFNIVDKCDGYYEMFSFVNRNKPDYSFYINHFNLLENFILYFKEFGSIIIEACEKNKTILFNGNATYLKIVQNICNVLLPKEDSALINLTSCFKLKRYPFIGEKTKIYISPREFECLQYLGKGFSYKEVGNKLHISSRTVEAHIRYVKSKFNMSSISRLLEMYHKSELSYLAR
jgi:DNA-binding CsgD family transcriptional regulator